MQPSASSATSSAIGLSCRRWVAAVALSATLVSGLWTAGRAAEPAPVPPALPATLPAAAPATLPADARIARLFSELADPSPATREAAKIALMGLDGRDLLALQRVVRASLPLDPAQATVLREIVLHVRSAALPYDAFGEDGFLGVQLGLVTIGPKPKDEEPEGPRQFDPRGLQINPDANTAVVILARMPGFCGARLLNDGDVLVDIVERPGVTLRTPMDVARNVQGIGAGQTVTFNLLRQGRMIRVPIKLDPRPDAADGMNGAIRMNDLVRDRARQASEYWEAVFARMLKQDNG